MKTRLVWLLLAMLFAAPLPGRAQDTAQDTSAATQEYNFGTIQVGAPPITHTFVLHNSQKAAIVLTQVTPGCECTTAYVGTDTPQTLPVTVAPGQDAQIHVSINPEYLAPGPILKYVYITLQGQNIPAYTMEMAGTLQMPPATKS